VSRSKSATKSFDQLNQGLDTVVHGLGEIRNAFGTGHGFEATHVPISLPHARLVATTALALATFLWDIHDATRSTP